ncbi:MAG: hypothetical protein ACRC7V_11615 [Lachnospiraceae bacterium]
MITDQLDNVEIVEYFSLDIKQLLKYKTWLEEKQGQAVANNYKGEGTFAFPVYDSMLLSFVKCMKETSFMNKNYQYSYRRNNINNAEEELQFIKRATVRQLEQLGCILSKYCLSGYRKGTVWGEGVMNGVYLATLKKMEEIMETFK